MIFDPESPVNRCCAEGQTHEGRGDLPAAQAGYRQAWNIAQTDLEKLTAAHYVARTMGDISEKLDWDLLALHIALRNPDGSLDALLPSLYLNTGKGHEDLQAFEPAGEHYQLALKYAPLLPDDGYGRMIRSGILAGLDRLRKHCL